MVRQKKKINIFDQVMAKNMRRLREDRGLSQAELAERYGCDQSHISQLESGHRGFGAETQSNLAKAFRIEIKELWEMPRGIASDDLHILWEKVAELKSGTKGKLIERLVRILMEGPSDASEALDGLSKVLENNMRPDQSKKDAE